MSENSLTGVLFFLILPAISFLYASVGHGGASGYLALMALFSFTPEVMKPTALLLNLFVAGIAFLQYYRAGYFNKTLFWSFAASSIPLAFLGGSLAVDPLIYRKILGVLLIIAVLRLLNVYGKDAVPLRRQNWWLALLMGGIIGFFSGLIGIGGGIILTPVILLFHWAKMKEAACVSALFIWVNSAAGLAGQFQSGFEFSSQYVLMVAIALSGGFFGAYYGSNLLSGSRLKGMLAMVLVLASLKLLFLE